MGGSLHETVSRCHFSLVDFRPVECEIILHEEAIRLYFAAHLPLLMLDCFLSSLFSGDDDDDDVVVLDDDDFDSDSEDEPGAKPDATDDEWVVGDDDDNY